MNTNTCERQRVTTAEVPKRSEGHADVAARTGRRPSRTVELCGVVVAFAATLIGCTQPEEARKILEAQGLTNITITGYNAFACSEDDNYSTGFEATSVNGTRVKGTVCKGMLKGATVRYE